MPPTADILRRLIARSGLLIVTALLGAAGGWLYAATRAPSYQASAYVVLTPTVPSVADSTAVSLAQAYGRITTQDGVLGRAEAILGSGSTDALRRAVRVSTSPDAPLVRITASARNPALAATRANAVATSLIGYGNLRSPRTRVRLDSFADASAPASPASPRPALDIAVGAAAGLLIGGLAVTAGAGRRAAEPAGAEPAGAGATVPREAGSAAGWPAATAGAPPGRLGAEPPVHGRLFWAVPAEQVMGGLGSRHPAASPAPPPSAPSPAPPPSATRGADGAGTAAPAGEQVAAGATATHPPAREPDPGGGDGPTDRIAATDRVAAGAGGHDGARDGTGTHDRASAGDGAPDPDGVHDGAPDGAGAPEPGGNGKARDRSEDDTVPVPVSRRAADAGPRARGKAGRP